jgi:hypothetical protein
MSMAVFMDSIEPYSPDYDFESYCESLEQLFIFNNVVDVKKVTLFITYLGHQWNMEYLRTYCVQYSLAKTNFQTNFKSSDGVMSK